MEDKKKFTENDLICHDCKKKLKEGDECVLYETSAGDFFKCKKCHEKDFVLRNYQPCEVYSRIVGYMRPVANWNKGKQAEWAERKTYKL